MEQNAPERIWAWDDSTPMERNKGWSACDAGTGSTAYVQAALYDAAWNEAIEAAATIAQTHKDRSDELMERAKTSDAILRNSGLADAAERIEDAIRALRRETEGG